MYRLPILSRALDFTGFHARESADDDNINNNYESSAYEACLSIAPIASLHHVILTSFRTLFCSSLVPFVLSKNNVNCFALDLYSKSSTFQFTVNIHEIMCTAPSAVVHLPNGCEPPPGPVRDEDDDENAPDGYGDDEDDDDSLYQLDQTTVAKFYILRIFRDRIVPLLARQLRSLCLSIFYCHRGEASVTTEVFRCIGQLVSLEQLRLEVCCGLTAGSLAELAPLQSLTDFDLNGSEYQAADLITLFSHPNLAFKQRLRRLVLSHSDVTGGVIVAAAQQFCESLEQLDFFGTRMEAADLMQYYTALPKFTQLQRLDLPMQKPFFGTLTLTSTSNTNSDTIATTIGAHCRFLTVLKININSNNDLADIARCFPLLTELVLDLTAPGTRFQPQAVTFDLAPLSQQLQHLELLSFSGCSDGVSVNVAGLAGAASLTTLVIANLHGANALQNAAELFRSRSNLPRLKTLDMTYVATLQTALGMAAIFPALFTNVVPHLQTLSIDPDLRSAQSHKIFCDSLAAVVKLSSLSSSSSRPAQLTSLTLTQGCNGEGMHLIADAFPLLESLYVSDELYSSSDNNAAETNLTEETLCESLGRKLKHLEKLNILFFIAGSELFEKIMVVEKSGGDDDDKSWLMFPSLRELELRIKDLAVLESVKKLTQHRQQLSRGKGDVSMLSIRVANLSELTQRHSYGFDDDYDDDVVDDSDRDGDE